MSVTAYPLPPQLEEYVDSPELMARSDRWPTPRCPHASAEKTRHRNRGDDADIATTIQQLISVGNLMLLRM